MATTKKGGSKASSKKGSNGATTGTKTPAKAAAKTAAKAPPSNQTTRVYAITMSSVKGLELTCEKDEADLSAKIISLQLATNNGDKVTAGIYEDDDEGDLGELAFEEYKTDVDEQSLKAIHQTKGDTFLFKGEAYVKSNPIKVLVFREN
ncbi:MAG TPA: hypothetical protein VJS44_16195 [Pyrinomonadaceae bacterium]|nr:hypothetical protein [Pyrinomonadaceae bacterium]